MIQGTGDLAQMLYLRRANTDLRQQLDSLNTELASGRAAKPLQHLSGDFSALAGIERDLTMHKAWRTSRLTASAFAGTQQATLSRLHGSLAGSGAAFLAAGSSGANIEQEQILAVASRDFDTIVPAFNATYAGRSVFAGTATESAALAPAGDILAALQTAIGGAATAADVLTAAESFFMDAGGGFDTNAYRGGGPLSAFALDDVEEVRVSVTAAADPVRRALLPLAIASLMSDGLLAGDPVERSALIGALGERMLDGSGGVLAMQADLGSAEARIEQAGVRAAAVQSSLALARNELIGVDEYQTASKLEETASKLETIYLLTSRMSGLSLARYLS